jgi:drug/metabolite transporter (DMT)-like permease
MSKPSQPENDKIALFSADAPARRYSTNIAPSTPILQPQQKTHLESYGSFTTPLSPITRPFSPESFSNLSINDFEQLQTSRALNTIDDDDDKDSPNDHVFIQPTSLRARIAVFWIRNKGLFLMLLAQFFGTLMNVTTRILEIEGNAGQGLHPMQILFPRMGITCVLATAYMWYKQTPHFPLGAPEVRGLLLVRGFAGFFGVFGMYFSLLYLPLADATVITFLAPGLACWVCAHLLCEPFTVAERLGTFVSLIGVIFIARPTSLFTFSHERGPPPPDAGGLPDLFLGIMSGGGAGDYDSVTPAQRLSAVLVALVGVTGTVITFTCIRWIGTRAHPLVSVNYFAAWSTLVSLFCQSSHAFGVGFSFPADLREWGLLAFLGICGFVMVRLHHAPRLVVSLTLVTPRSNFYWRPRSRMRSRRASRI